MIINHNLNAMNAHRNMGANTTATGKAMEKLSSGLRINRAGDDAAGLAISEKMRGQIKGLTQASRNSQDAISLIQTAEGALNESHSIVQRMRELAVQASNDTNITADREKIAAEITQLEAELTKIADQTEFNKKKLLDGTASGMKFQVGANSGQMISLTIGTMGAAALSVAGIGESMKTASAGQLTGMIDTIDKALEKISSQRSDLGSVQNRLEHTITNLNTSAENLQAAESRIRDIDMASEMMNYTKSNILNQAAQSMLGQANQAPQGVLQLLG